MPHDAAVATSVQPEAGSAEELRELRQRLGVAAYIAYCRAWSAERGLPSNKARAMIWRDLVLGCGECEAVPQLSESIIRQTSRLTQASPTSERECRRVNSNSSTSIGGSSSSFYGNGGGNGTMNHDNAERRQGTPRVQQGTSETGDKARLSLDFARVQSSSLTTLATSTTTTTSSSSAEPTPRPNTQPEAAVSSGAARTSDGRGGGGCGGGGAASLTALPANEAEGRCGSTGADTRQGRKTRPAVRATSVPLPRHRGRSRKGQTSQLPGTVTAATSVPLVPPTRQAPLPFVTTCSDTRIGTRSHSQPSSLREGSGMVGGVVQAYRLPENCKPRVVNADVQRSLWGLYPEVGERARMRGRLRRMLLRILACHPAEHFYYQGLHELMGFVLYVLSPYLALDEVVAVCEGLLRLQWASFATRTLQPSQAMLYAMHRIIEAEDTALAAALETCGVGPESHYAVSWLITWYAHDLRNNAVLTRLFDYFIAWPDELAVIFVSAALVLRARAQVLTWIEAEVAEAAEGDKDAVLTMAHVYSKMVHLPGLLLETASEAELNALFARATVLRGRHAAVAIAAQRQFMQGEVSKLGVLASRHTRNAALRLLWRLLPREWRRLAEHKADMVLLQHALLVGAVAGVAAALLYTRAFPAQVYHALNEFTRLLSSGYERLCSWLHLPAK